MRSFEIGIRPQATKDNNYRTTISGKRSPLEMRQLFIWREWDSSTRLWYLQKGASRGSHDKRSYLGDCPTDFGLIHLFLCAFHRPCCRYTAT